MSCGQIEGPQQSEAILLHTFSRRSAENEFSHGLRPFRISSCPDVFPDSRHEQEGWPLPVEVVSMAGKVDW